MSKPMGNKNTAKALKLAHDYGLHVETGAKHHKVFGRDGRLVVVIPKGTGQNWPDRRNKALRLIREAGEK